MRTRPRLPALALLGAMLPISAGALRAQPADADERPVIDLLETERLGELRVGLPAEELRKVVSCELKKGDEVYEDATGEHVQSWDSETCGVELSMASEQAGGPKVVRAVTITAPSTLKTLRGIGIGSSEADVVSAYRDLRDDGASVKGESFVAGSIYGGLIFELHDGKVASVFLGAAAE